METVPSTASAIDEEVWKDRPSRRGWWSFSLNAPLGEHWPEALRDAARVLLALSGQDSSSGAIPLLGHTGLAADLSIDRETGEMRICGWIPPVAE